MDSHRWFLRPLGPDAHGVRNYGLRPQSNCMGWDVIPTTVQRRTGNVPPQLQRSVFLAPDLDRDRLTDPQCAFLRHGIWACTLEDSGSLLVVPLATRSGGRNPAEVVRPSCRSSRELVLPASRSKWDFSTYYYSG